MNIHNKKTQRTISAIIVIILVAAMVIPSFLSILGKWQAYMVYFVIVTILV